MNYTEHQRLIAVNRFKQLDEGITKDLNEIVDMIAQICETPVSLVTLLDKDIQWFKAAAGTEVDCTAREMSFCNSTIKQEGLLIIPDTLADNIHKVNPMVTGEPYVRFYAGAPLITKDGFAIGSLCIIDMKPRSLTLNQKKAVTVMANQVVNLMELNYSMKILAEKHRIEHEQTAVITESELKLKAMFDSTNDTHMLIGKNYEVLAFNKSAATLVRRNCKHKLSNGDCILNYTDPLILNQFKKYFGVALTGKTIKREWLVMRGTPMASWKVTTFIPVKNKNSEIIGVALNSTDITHQKSQEDYINIQNEALNRIAIMQSHELRRPVASLLGFMDLLKMEKINSDYFGMMEITINELDEKIRGIVKDSENTLHSRNLDVVA